MKYLIMIVMVMIPCKASGNNDIDKWANENLHWQEHEKAADILSTILVAFGLTVPCMFNHTWHCVANEGLQVGISIGSAEITKHFIHRTRPDMSDDKSFFSEHTALACVATIRSKALAVCPAVGWLRIAANKHWATDVITGGMVGMVISF